MQPWVYTNEEKDLEFFKQSTVSRLRFVDFFVCGIMDRFQITKKDKIMTQFYIWLVSTILITILSGMFIVKYLKKVEN